MSYAGADDGQPLAQCWSVRCLTAVLTVCGLALGSSAFAQSEGKVAVGVSVSSKVGVARDTDGHINFPGFVWRFGHGGEGWGFDYGLGWYAADLQRTLGTQSTEFGELHVRPVVVGYGYSKRLRDRYRVSAKLLGGYSFNSFKVHPNFGEAYQRVNDVSMLAIDVSNTFVLRPEVSTWIDVTRKIGINVSAGYTVARPEVTMRTSLGSDTRRIRADMFTVRFGAVYSIF